MGRQETLLDRKKSLLTIRIHIVSLIIGISHTHYDSGTAANLYGCYKYVVVNPHQRASAQKGHSVVRIDGGNRRQRNLLIGRFPTMLNAFPAVPRALWLWCCDTEARNKDAFDACHDEIS
jgi:hypothetical protein